MLNEDYRDMLRILLGNEVRFLVVGAYALGAYGYPRATGDIDIWVDASRGNSKKSMYRLPNSVLHLPTFQSKRSLKKTLYFRSASFPAASISSPALMALTSTKRMKQKRS